MNGWKAPDARGWIGIGVFAMSVMLLGMMTIDDLRKDEFFQTIATVVIANGLMAVISWAYSASKGGGELAEKNAAIVHENAMAATSTAALLAEKASPTLGSPAEVKIVNPPEDPANVTEMPPKEDFNNA